MRAKGAAEIPETEDIRQDSGGGRAASIVEEGKVRVPGHCWIAEHTKERVGGCSRGLLIIAAEGQALRIALALAFMQWAMTDPLQAEPKCVSIGSLNGALELIEQFFKPMALRVYGEIATPSDLAATSALAKWIMATKAATFNAHTIRDQAGIPAMLRGKADKGGVLMKVTCDGLIEFGWIRHTGGRSDGRPGRQGQNYEVNPALWDAIAQSGDQS